ncbi:MAG: SPOR domain-containing protein [Prolixibacteraceae bacterium]|nr:SPOR domain-containing protein [Prolixibacteraceae bacterium]
MKKIILLFVLLIAGAYAFAQNYYLVVASFDTQVAANQKVQELKAGGFVSSGVLNAGQSNKFRVYIDTFSANDKAYATMKKYRSAFPDAWVFDLNAVYQKQKMVGDSLKKQELESMKLDLSSNKQLIDALSIEIFSLKSEIDHLLAQSIKSGANSDSILGLQQRLNALDIYLKRIEATNNYNTDKIEEFDKAKTGFVQKTDTVAYAWQAVGDRFDFGRPKFTFDFGVMHSQFLSLINPAILSYFNITETQNASHFYGFNINGNLHLGNRWGTAIDVQAYVYNQHYYLFPNFVVGYSKQIGNTALKIGPALGIGTEFIIPPTGSAKGAQYIIASPALDFELGLNKYLSLYARSSYHFSFPIYETTNDLIKIQHLNHAFGLRINIQ